VPASHAGKAGRTGLPEAGARFRIAVDGTWFHDNGPILRPEMVKLFARILRRETGADGLPTYALVTPYERHAVTVEDAPFVAVSVESMGESTSESKARLLTFTTNIDVEVIADRAHPIMVRSGDKGDPRPYLALDDGMEALIARSVYFELAALAEPDSTGRLGVWSEGVFFPLDPA
jgi:hypothetical protein